MPKFQETPDDTAPWLAWLARRLPIPRAPTGRRLMQMLRRLSDAVRTKRHSAIPGPQGPISRD